VSDITTENGAQLIIEEKGLSFTAQLPESVSLRGTYKDGDNYFTLDGVDGLQMFDFLPSGPSTRMKSSGFALLDPSGNIKLETLIMAGKGRVRTDEVEIMGGSDLSEYFDVRGDDLVTPGMLVSIAGEDGSLEITQAKRDKKVVGIVSGANGISTGLMMGQKGSIADGDYPVALTGRTYVYANTENGAIEAGDFLTSSSTPGYAMKVKKHRKSKGAIVGKAMTSLDEGSGFVLVLVNLQ